MRPWANAARCGGKNLASSSSWRNAPPRSSWPPSRPLSDSVRRRRRVLDRLGGRPGDRRRPSAGSIVDGARRLTGIENLRERSVQARERRRLVGAMRFEGRLELTGRGNAVPRILRQRLNERIRTTVQRGRDCLQRRALPAALPAARSSCQNKRTASPPSVSRTLRSAVMSRPSASPPVKPTIGISRVSKPSSSGRG